MALTDDLKAKAQDALDNDELRQKAEEMAKQHGISVEDAKAKLMGNKDEE